MSTDNDKLRATIMRLSELCDLVGYADYVAEHTKYGKRPHRDAWGYTQAYMRFYGDPQDTDALIGLFKGEGLPNEVEATRWLFQHDDLVP